MIFWRRRSAGNWPTPTPAPWATRSENYSPAPLRPPAGTKPRARAGGAPRWDLYDAPARAMGDAERELSTRAIAAAGGNQAKASRWLGVTRVTMKAKLVQFGLYAGHEPESS